MKPKDGHHEVGERSRVHQVHRQRGNPCAVQDTGTEAGHSETKINTKAQNGKKRQASRHDHELTMVLESDAVVNPAAIVVKSQDRLVVAPTLVGTPWQRSTRCTLRPTFDVEPPWVRKRHEGHASQGHCMDADDETGEAQASQKGRSGGASLQPQQQGSASYRRDKEACRQEQLLPHPKQSAALLLLLEDRAALGHNINMFTPLLCLAALSLRRLFLALALQPC
mmetsp:Transcript_55588/g.129412  ORF Transcript_55588/g.129412 Transcript_55588/m.129412 type:complete len:224 (+) Transcript_55588:307-978(+)